ncbi:hypothetical protein GGI07_003470 [Coemansia sp. Benny D115]|nr:hypothetical protein GGI07_003470 [Coemansia sp. Benny D115]
MKAILLLQKARVLLYVGSIATAAAGLILSSMLIADLSGPAFRSPDTNANLVIAACEYMLVLSVFSLFYFPALLYSKRHERWGAATAMQLATSMTELLSAIAMAVVAFASCISMATYVGSVRCDGRAPCIKYRAAVVVSCLASILTFLQVAALYNLRKRAPVHCPSEAEALEAPSVKEAAWQPERSCAPVATPTPLGFAPGFAPGPVPVLVEMAPPPYAERDSGAWRLDVKEKAPLEPPNKQ